MGGHGLSLADFTGAWRLERRIVDLRGGVEGRFEGRALFTPGADGLVYEESGQLCLGAAQPVEATRRLLWRTCPRGGIAVFFADGQAFHRIAADRLMPGDTHVCAPDIYHVDYDFRAWPVWSATWRVVGPRKDYRLISRYSGAGTG
ncbi:MAG: trigger factor [Alphaproteobacteria bacterium HGW-Alphaproteobacteria-2]|nr:MAG: trigger factor [Alphaproteobacteria bacterium HGW-Alphaproteobacteria-2]